MNLFTLLAHLPHDQLRRLANEFGITAASPSKRTLLDSLTLKYRDPHFLSNRLDELPSRSRILLRRLVFFSEPGGESFPFPDASPNAGPSGDSPVNPITPLLESGLLFLDQTGPEKRVLFPLEIRRGLRPLFCSPFAALRPRAERSPESVSPRVPALEAVFHWLSLLSRRKARITLKGAIPRRFLEKWLERHGQEAGAEDFFPFVLDFTRACGLLLSRHGTYLLAPGADAWFSQDERQLWNDLWNYFRGSILVSEPEIQGVLIALYAAEDWVRQQQKLPMFLVDDLFQALASNSRPDSEYPSLNRVIRWLRWLEFVGIVQLGRRQTPPTFTLTRAAARLLFDLDLPGGETIPAPCILQPNFDLLIPPGVGYGTLWKLEQTAEFRRRDVFTEYHLSRRSVMSAMRRGWSRAEVLGFLEELTGSALPGNVRYTLEEWCARYGQIQLRRTVLVECAAADLAEELEHVPEVQSLLGPRIAERFFAVPESRARNLIRLLRGRGYEPSPVPQAAGKKKTS
ncbi:MAG: helicase-associated domain-containing protein [bacterium]